MPSESGDFKLLANFRKLIDLVSADSDYKPSNAALKKPALNALHTSATDAAHDVPDKRTANMVTISDRETGFSAVSPLMTRVHGLAKASGAPPQTVEDLNTFKRKFSPTRRKQKGSAAPAENAPSTEEPQAEKQRSSAQTGCDNQLGHLRGYLGVLSTVSDYNPSEADLKLPALQSFVDDLHAKNDAVSASFVPLSQARGLRDQLLYLGDNSVVNTALLVKEYVKGAFGTQSQLYKQIRGLEFKRAKK
jgi:hypothetical protein